MRKIYKYSIQDNSLIGGHPAEIVIPKKAQILRVAYQRREIYLWAVVETENDTETRKFKIYATGHELYESPENLRHIETILSDGESFVWHIFEVLG